MTVHPFRPADPDDPETAGDTAPSDEAAAARERLDRVLAAFGDEPDEPVAELDELFDDVDDSPNRFGSFDRDHRLAHRAVTPGLLSGLCWLDLELCALFHAVVFELLEDVGDFDGLIATPDFFVDVGTRRMRAANQWMFDHPAPVGEDDECSDRDAVADHSQELALAVGSNPSLTFASTAALRERLLEGVLELGAPDLVVTDEQIDWLADLTFRLVAELRHDVVTIGGASVWAAGSRSSTER